MGLGNCLLNSAAPELGREDVTGLLPQAWRDKLKDQKVYVTDMTSAERLEYTKAFNSDSNKPDDLTLLLMCLVDEGGERLFEPNQKDEVARKLPGSTLIKLVQACLKVCGF